MRGASASAASPASCRCSGASASTNASAASMSSSTECCASSASRIAWSSLTATVSDPSPCSACPARSARNASRSAPCGGHHGQVRRPGEPVDADHAGHLPLGLLHPQRPRADDHVDLRDRLGAVRQRGHGLGAGDGEVGVGAAQLRRGDHHRMRRADHVHLVHARGARRHDAHHDRRRIRIAAAGRVDRGAAHGHVAQLHRCPCGSVTRRSSSRPASATARTLWIATSSPARTRRRRAHPARVENGRDRAPAPKPTARLELERAASPPERTAAMIPATRQPPTRPPAPTRGSRQPVPTQLLQDRVDLRRLHAVGDRVGDQARRRDRDLLADHEAVLAQRRAGRVRSTIPCTMPVSGASSTEPLTSTISTWRPVFSK